MGQQQILLIILSLIVVAIAISVGISMFQSKALSAHQDDLIININNIVMQALVYKQTPQSLSGGGGSFMGFNPSYAENSRGHIGNPDHSPNQGLKIETAEANYFIEIWPGNGYPQRLQIIASSKIYGEGNSWDNVANARIRAYFDKNGELINLDNNPNRQGFMISGDW